MLFQLIRVHIIVFADLHTIVYTVDPLRQGVAIFLQPKDKEDHMRRDDVVKLQRLVSAYASILRALGTVMLSRS